MQNENNHINNTNHYNQFIFYMVRKHKYWKLNQNFQSLGKLSIMQLQSHSMTSKIYGKVYISKKHRNNNLVCKRIWLRNLGKDQLRRLDKISSFLQQHHIFGKDHHIFRNSLDLQKLQLFYHSLLTDFSWIQKNMNHYENHLNIQHRLWKHLDE